MMDASAMYPRGFHPMKERTLPDLSGPAPVLHRIDVPVKYYFIDFGISTRFPADQHPRLVLGTQGLDDEVPELSDTTPYDPFKTDIFIIGNLLRQEFLQVRTSSASMPSVLMARRMQKYSNTQMLAPLVERMVNRNPDQRPDAVEVLQEWKAIRRRISSIQRFWRLRAHKESWLATLWYDFQASVSLFVPVTQSSYLCIHNSRRFAGRCRCQMLDILTLQTRSCTRKQIPHPFYAVILHSSSGASRLVSRCTVLSPAIDVVSACITSPANLPGCCSNLFH